MDIATSQKINKFFTKFKLTEYKSKELLVRAYDNPRGVFYLKEGFVKMYSISKNGDEAVLYVFKPNSFFPMSWAINSSRNHYFYEAMTPVKTYVATKENAVEFVKNNPDVLYDLLQRVFIGIDGLLIKMEYLMSGDAYCRLAVELITEAKRFGVKNDKSYTLKISEKDLATEVGIARETVSREIKILKNKELITIAKKFITIKDLAKLEKEIS